MLQGLWLLSSGPMLQQPAPYLIRRSFPGMFASVQFGNHWGATGRRRSKRDMCADVGAQLLIDDNMQ